ncbi:YicC/YloC family endoribonuclease [Legionella sp. W05-934-2]|jgi:uncharacterized protein (TIGR00255 family)|uniref:YicC/YloC family endoribonuclease n=1 Tax=Legionella sp. W05-934-2 TaxID=1198649 RepID=UPI00346241A2
MLLSMTGFATYQMDLAEVLLTWEFKTVNHRYQDLTIRLPDAYRSLEGLLRERVKSKISRGKVDIQLKLKEKQVKNNYLAIDIMRVKKIVEQVNEVSEQVNEIGQLSWDTLLTLPDILIEHEAQLVSEETLVDSFEQGLKRLWDSRRQEGQFLQTIIAERLVCLLDLQKNIANKVHALNSHLKAKLEGRLAELSITIGDDRLMQEVALMLTKMDVAEELDRIESHCQQIELAMKMKEPVGRRLDFLMQELNREINTLSVKIDDADVRKQTVEMKVLIEQMREQIQNVE